MVGPTVLFLLSLFSVVQSSEQGDGSNTFSTVSLALVIALPVTAMICSAALIVCFVKRVCLFKDGGKKTAVMEESEAISTAQSEAVTSEARSSMKTEKLIMISEQTSPLPISPSAPVAVSVPTAASPMPDAFPKQDDDDEYQQLEGFRTVDLRDATVEVGEEKTCDPVMTPALSIEVGMSDLQPDSSQTTDLRTYHGPEG